uniref:Uncharacterized protein n=1 Tax=Wenling reo-like virus 1 TaxID=1923538 RepID=A0A1L3KP97_9VIRU|nr:hypothetical protein 1 [Wenling reo-like virus 1]
MLCAPLPEHRLAILLSLLPKLSYNYYQNMKPMRKQLRKMLHHPKQKPTMTEPLPYYPTQSVPTTYHPRTAQITIIDMVKSTYTLFLLIRPLYRYALIPLTMLISLWNSILTVYYAPLQLIVLLPGLTPFPKDFSISQRTYLTHLLCSLFLDQYIMVPYLNVIIYIMHSIESYILILEGDTHLSGSLTYCFHPAQLIIPYYKKLILTVTGMNTFNLTHYSRVTPLLSIMKLSFCVQILFLMTILPWLWMTYQMMLLIFAG